MKGEIGRFGSHYIIEAHKIEDWGRQIQNTLETVWAFVVVLIFCMGVNIGLIFYMIERGL